MFGIHSPHGYHEVVDGITIKTLNHGKHMLMTEFVLRRGALLPEHSHVYEQTGYLVKGRMLLYIQEKSIEVKAGDSWNVPGGAPHRAEVLEDSIAIEVFSPVREDYLQYVTEDDVK